VQNTGINYMDLDPVIINLESGAGICFLLEISSLNLACTDKSNSHHDSVYTS